MGKLKDDLQKLTAAAIIDCPEIVNAYKQVVANMKGEAKSGECSCKFYSGGYGLSPVQKESLKQRLRNEGIEVIEHEGYDQRDPAWTELKW